MPQEAVFNLSHSGDYVLCAYSDVAKAQVGCDLEEVKRVAAVSGKTVLWRKGISPYSRDERSGM